MSEINEKCETRYWRALDDGRVECTLCPRLCQLRDGKRGVCFVRMADHGQIVLTTHGRSSGFCIDPVEKKPLFHFLPGTPVLSFGTAGCNLTCRFCQNWDISKSRQMDTLSARASPEQIARAALQYGCRSVAFTYNDPVVFMEYALDVAVACHAVGVQTIAVTAGYINPEPAVEFFAGMDAANVDLKAFSESFYHQICGGHLQPVLETLCYVHRHTSVWLELTTLLIPGLNDSDAEIRALCEWVGKQLGPDVPLHFTAFHPDYRLRDIPATPNETLSRARSLALACGLHHAYIGNVHDSRGESSWCPTCGNLLIERDWYRLGDWGLTAGCCKRCGYRLPGRIEATPGLWGPRRLAITPGE